MFQVTPETYLDDEGNFLEPDETDKSSHFRTYDEAVAHAKSAEGYQVVVLSTLSPDEWLPCWPTNETGRSLDELREVRDLSWMIQRGTATVAHVPAGTYFLGDPCYAVPPEQWRQVVDSWFEAHGPVARLSNGRVLGFNTMYGDGGCLDQFGHNYAVDSGNIGLTPESIGWSKPADALANLGRVVTFNEPTHAISLDGSLTFGPYRIDTT